jgi:hypothetical protein
VRGPCELPILASVLLVALPACRSGERADSTRAASHSGDPAETPATEQERSAPPPASAPDPERADKLADLDELCAALDHDYVDGTLSDYYATVEMRSAWGKAQRAAGDASITPGRLLEKAVEELSPGAQAPELGHCRTLLDYLDDVE